MCQSGVGEGGGLREAAGGPLVTLTSSFRVAPLNPKVSVGLMQPTVHGHPRIVADQLSLKFGLVEGATNVGSS